MKSDIENGCSFLGCGIWIIILIAWTVNIIKLTECDFDVPLKEEVIHLVGVFIPPASLITCWF